MTSSELIHGIGDFEVLRFLLQAISLEKSELEDPFSIAYKLLI